MARLGKEIRISPKSEATIIRKGLKREYYTDIVSVLIGIGKDHTAELIMDVEAWQALKAGEVVKVTTTEQFKKDYLK